MTQGSGTCSQPCFPVFSVLAGSGQQGGKGHESNLTCKTATGPKRPLVRFADNGALCW